MSGIAGIPLASRILSIGPICGEGFELGAIAAVVIGGASLFGGRNSIIGTLLGVLTMMYWQSPSNAVRTCEAPYVAVTAIQGYLLLSRSRRSYGGTCRDFSLLSGVTVRARPS